MTTLVVATKACSTCGATKPLSGFYRSKKTRDGHAYSCKSCTKTRVRDSVARRRAEMGDEAWLTSRVEIVQKHRATDAYSSAPMTAYKRALGKLRHLHPQEFQSLLRIERYNLGLNPDTHGDET